MTFKKPILLILIQTLFSGCTWIYYQEGNETILKNVVKKKYRHSTWLTFCDDLTKGKEIKGSESLNYYCYEFDSIRIYAPKDNKILNQIIQRGHLTGQMFFPAGKTNSCRPRPWNSPIKYTYNDWYGYNIVIHDLFEFIIRSFPKGAKKKLNMFHVYRLRVDQDYYIGPTVYEMQIVNENYKSNNDTITFELFLQTARVTSFLFTGSEI